MPINKFTTLLDLARQAKIITGETATFDGKIEAGIPFSGYPTGVDTGSTVSLGVVSSEDAVFSGNTGTTVFDVSNTGSTNYDAIFSGYSATTWSNPLFSGNTSGLTLPITPLSASTQIVGPFWTLTQTGMTGDYVIGTQYTGYSITYSFFDVSQFGTGFTYSGFTTASQENFSAGTLDYKGPLDYISSVEDASVDGRLTTNKLTVTGGASSATTGYVLTQTGVTGEVGWVFNSASGTTDTNFAITDLTFTGNRTHDLDGYELNLVDSSSKFQVKIDDPTNPFVRLTGNTSALSEIRVANIPNGGLSIGHRGLTEASFPGYGKQGDGFVYSSEDQNGLNIISQPGSGTEDYIRFFVGQLSGAAGTPDLYIQGTGTTKGFIGINTDSPTERLHVDGNTKIEGNSLGNPSLIIGDNDEITFTTLGTSISNNVEINSTPNSSGIRLNDGASGLGNQLSLLNFYNGSGTYNAIAANLGATDDSTFFITNNAVSGNTVFRCGPNGTDADDVMYLYGSGNTASNPLLIFSGDSKPLVYSDGNLEVFGNIGINQIGSVGGGLPVYIDSNGKLSDSVSDERLKENILPLNNSLNILLQLSGVSYNWINREDSGNDRFYGFIAQQLEKVDNHLTFTSKSSGYMGVRNDAITPLIVESIKEIYNNPSIPNYTPTSSNDTYGNVGNITTDDDYLYIKTNNGWKRTSLQSF